MVKRAKRGLPSRQEIVDFIAASPTPVGKREIARAFKVDPAYRVALKGMIKEIERAGEVERGKKRRLAPVDRLPEIGVIEIVAVDIDGEVTARPAMWLGDKPAPKIFVLENRLGGDEVGQRLVARLTRREDGAYEAQVVRLLVGETERVLGVFRRHGEGGRIEPTDRKIKTEYRVVLADTRDAAEGELVLADVLPARRLGQPQARIVERLGHIGDARTISLIAIHTLDIPTVFPPEALAQAEAGHLSSRPYMRRPFVWLTEKDFAS